MVSTTRRPGNNLSLDFLVPHFKTTRSRFDAFTPTMTTRAKHPTRHPRLTRGTAKGGRPAAAALRRAKPGKNGHVVPASAWAAESVFNQAKIASWEGWSEPLTLTSLFPAPGSFLDQLYPALEDGFPAWHELIHPLDRSRVTRFFSAIAGASGPRSIDYRAVDQHGAAIWLRHSVVSHRPLRGRTQIRGFVADIQTEKEFQLESLRISEREQNRIGQDLHDDLCQVLAGLSCLMRVVESRIAPKLPGEVESLKEINLQIVDAMHRTRALTHGLFPGKVQIADIRGALLELASQVRARFKVVIATEFIGRFPKHSPAHTIQIYRLTQEAMSNAIKHGRASKIDVRLEALADTMVLSVKDNGSGLPKPGSVEPGMGLNIMRYRAGLLGGEVSVKNDPSGGAVALLTYPFEN